MTKAPMIVPPTLPRPPDIEVPPSTAAAMALSSKRLAGRRMRRHQLRRDDQADDRGAEAGEHIDEHLDPPDPDAGQARRPLVAADGEDVPAERRVPGDIGCAVRQSRPGSRWTPASRAACRSRG